jgi:hypothetical protein
MKATLPWLAAVLAASLAVSAAHAQSFDPRLPPSPYPPQSPDCCGPYYYARNVYGAWYGPNYFTNPGYLPYNGMVRPWAPCGGGATGASGPMQLGSPSFPTHPYARGPRDFFMVD